jgi:hypothetical protein
MTSDESSKSPLGDGRIAEAIVNPDRTWVALDAAGKPMEFVDVDDFEIFDALVHYPYEPEPAR